VWPAAYGLAIMEASAENGNGGSGSGPSTGTERESVDFVRTKIAGDRAAGKHEGRVQTRFPPEPNGYLHIGHAKAICVNFGIAEEFEGARCNLRFDDTNPLAESTEFVDSIQADVRWLGFDWEDRLFFASGWFDRLFELAERLIEKGAAYVDDLSGEELRSMRGSASEPGRDSPSRGRSPEENLDLFRRMRAGEFPDGARTLRAKIDMSSPHLMLRDPVLYRILHAHHHRTGDAWCIYPTYDWAHGQCDALEGVTHSLCTLEFETHRPLYDWFLAELGEAGLASRPEQTEFARLNLTYTLVTKRKLRELVEDGHVSGWDDPRMPTLRGLRRRGYTPESIRAFCKDIGLARFNSRIDYSRLENALRADLNERAPRRMGVLDPIKLVIENYPEGQAEKIEAVNNPQDESAGTRMVPFSRELYIERDDFREEAPRKYHRLKPGQEVRLRYAYYVTCTGFEKDPETGDVTVVRGTYDPETKGGDSADGRKVKGTIHWVSAEHAIRPEVRLYDHLFRVAEPETPPEEAGEGGDFKDNLNPDSLKVLPVLAGAALEPSLAEASPGSFWQLERQGYFTVDTVDSGPGRPVFNRSVALKDSWAKIERKG
jgi:glutaminyl-tRNA synthetase